MSIDLYDYQIDAIKRLKSGSILCCGVGSGKSRTALAYYYICECNGKLKVNGKGSIEEPTNPKDLYIITTAKKRDSLEWEKEASNFVITKNRDTSIGGIQMTIDSWNNIKKYSDIKDAFFIFDEQRVVGKGVWVKTFWKITKKNNWILLSATPGDQWSDYIPVFVANGFYRNRTEFNVRHCIYNRYSKYPKIERYIDEGILIKYRRQILVVMNDQRKTIRHKENVIVDYNKELYKIVFKDRWNIYDNEPIKETGKLFYLIRRVVNSDPSRLSKVLEIVLDKKRCIIFYNHSYELEILRKSFDEIGILYSEWNGQRHESLPIGDRWVYLVQYSAGCEGWNCITCNTIIFYSQSYSYRMTEQAAGRIDRINTPYKDLYYYYIRSNASIDVAIYKALSKKKNFNEKSFSL